MLAPNPSTRILNYHQYIAKQFSRPYSQKLDTMSSHLTLNSHSIIFHTKAIITSTLTYSNIYIPYNYIDTNTYIDIHIYITIYIPYGHTTLISSLFNLQSKSINFNFGHFSAKYQGYSLTFWPKIAHFHHFSICNQNQSISILVIFRQNTKVIALLFGQKSLIFITFQSAIKINQFQFWSFFGKIPRL